MEINLNINVNKKIISFDFILVLILFCAAFLRFYHLGFQSAWLDEVSTLNVTNPENSISQLHDKIMQVEGTPHLFFLIVKGLAEIFGSSVFVARILSCVMGIASVYFIFLLAKEMFSRKVGYISAVLLTVNLFHIENSQEARSYSLFVFLVLVSYYQLVLFIKNQNIKNTVLLGLFVGLIPNAHIFGLLNIASIYTTLLFLIITNKNRQQKIHLFKQSFIAGIITLIVFCPVIPIIDNLSKTQSHWIPAATFDGIKSVFIDLFGRSKILAIIGSCLIFIFIFYVVFIKFIKKDYDKSNTQIMFISYIILLIWLLMNCTTIIIRSYTSDASLILARYFLGVLPALIITASYTISLISNKVFTYSFLGLVTLVSLHTIFIERKYYTTPCKSQYDLLTAKIVKENNNNDVIVSGYGWLLNYYFRNTSSTNFDLSDFPNFISSMRNKSIEKKAFWYYDGNSRPYNLSAEDQLFLEENFVVDSDLNTYYDCWAKHYVPKGEKSNTSVLQTDSLSMNDFSPRTMDDQKNLILFENGSITTKTVYLKKGEYEFVLNANSLPQIPIDNENAHITLKINNKVFAEAYLSEKKNNKKKTFHFFVSDTLPKTISLSFDNDTSKMDSDRNVIIYSIQIKKVGEKKINL
jgi:uncharacterized membrane protein